MAIEMKPRKCEFISTVIPVYNEEDGLPELLERTLKSLRSLNRKFELILIDDGSSDRSAEILEQAVKDNNGEVVVIYLNRNYGQHAAIIAGFSHVRGDLVITLDADLQNPPEEIPNLVEKADCGYDVVGTVRQNRQDTKFRRYASKVTNYAARKATGVNMNDYGCMLRAYRRQIVEAMLQCEERATFIPILGNSFARFTCEIPVTHSERAFGESKYSFFKLINLQFNLLTCMTTFPLRLLTYLGIAAALGGFISSILLVILRIVMGGEWTGQLLIFAALFFLAGIQLMGMGMIGEYISRIYNDVRARPKFFIERIIGRD